MNVKDVIVLLTERGWSEVRQKGSHKIFKHPEKAENIAVPFHGTKALKKGTLHDIFKKAGIK